MSKFGKANMFYSVTKRKFEDCKNLNGNFKDYVVVSYNDTKPKEKIVEKVVEKLVYIDKIVEKPVEKVVEKIVEKEVYFGQNLLQEKFTQDNEMISKLVKTDIAKDVAYRYYKAAKCNNKIHVLLVNFGSTTAYTRSTINDLLV